MQKSEIIIAKVWRSEIKGILLFLFLCSTCVYLSHKIPFSVIRGLLVPLDNSAIYLRLPLFWLLPAYILGTLLFRIYDVRYTMNAHGVESRSGIISFRTALTKVRYEDIRSIEVVQGLIDRFLDVGILEISTAATGGVEIILEGISAPLEVQDVILAERDQRQRAHRNDV